MLNNQYTTETNMYTLICKTYKFSQTSFIFASGSYSATTPTKATQANSLQIDH